MGRLAESGGCQLLPGLVLNVREKQELGLLSDHEQPEVSASLRQFAAVRAFLSRLAADDLELPSA